MSMLQRYIPNSFPLPHEVFELGLHPGSLLVYISLVYLKSLRHSTDALSCAVISKLIGLCEKSVRTHLRVLKAEGLIQVKNSGGRFNCTLCPIRGRVKERRTADPDQTQKICWRSTKQEWLTGEMFNAVFSLPNEVFQLGLKSGDLLVYIYLQYQKARTAVSAGPATQPSARQWVCLGKLCKSISMLWWTEGSSALSTRQYSAMA